MNKVCKMLLGRIGNCYQSDNMIKVATYQRDWIKWITLYYQLTLWFKLLKLD